MEWQKLGEHGYRIETDVLRWEAAGLLPAEHVAGMLRIIDTVNAQNGHCLMVAPVSDQQQPPEVRRAFVRFFRERPDVRISVGLYGGGVLMRAAVMLAIGALRMAGAMKNIHLSFFDSERSAEAWLSEERQHWQQTPRELA